MSVDIELSARGLRLPLGHSRSWLCSFFNLGGKIERFVFLTRERQSPDWRPVLCAFRSAGSRLLMLTFLRKLRSVLSPSAL
jgi:hypothetical protein